MKHHLFHCLPSTGIWSYRFACLFFTCVIISWSIIPQTIPLLPSTNHALLGVYIDQAASTRTRNDWLRIARGGIESVLAEWEAAATLVINDSCVLQSGKKKVLKDLEQSLSAGLSEWAVTQFHNQHNSREFSDFWVQMREAALTATFEFHNGEYIKDENGRLVVIKTDRETVAEDSAAFRNFWDEIIDQKVDDWYSGAQTAFSELLLDFGSEEAVSYQRTFKRQVLKNRFLEFGAMAVRYSELCSCGTHLIVAVCSSELCSCGTHLIVAVRSSGYALRYAPVYVSILTTQQRGKRSSQKRNKAF